MNDIWGRPVRGDGRFLLRTPGGSDVVLQPYHGRSNAPRAVDDYLGSRQVYRPSRLVLNLDSDSEGEAGASAPDQVSGIVETLGGEGHFPGPFAIGDSALYAVIWQCADPDPTPGVPSQQTLERLVSAAITARMPERGTAVERWLDDEPSGLELPKSYGHSYFAKWYADHGWAHFYEWVWQDASIAGELRSRLEAEGAWEIVEDLVRD